MLEARLRVAELRIDYRGNGLGLREPSNLQQHDGDMGRMALPDGMPASISPTRQVGLH